ncbi:MAG: gluzincin family metallopeptidase [Desulfobaccales bacterium]
MKIRVPIFVQDRWAAEREKIDTLENIDIEEDFFLDGPTTRRLAVLDFNPDTGELFPGARFKPPPAGKILGGYEIANAGDLNARDLNQVCVFSAVTRAMKMFEEKDALGRPLKWAFGAPQLFIVPRAGLWENAFYERDTHSLQFFYFEHPKRSGEMVFTSHSRDIVTHEAGHAFIDAIAPHLYNAAAPQSLALHEGIADLVAVLTAFRSRKLREAVLKSTNGSIEQSTAFSAVAEEFGDALDQTGLAGYLRNLYNHKTLDPNDNTLDDQNRPNRVSRTEPHELSEVLSGALYGMMVRLHSALKKDYAPDPGESDYSVSGKALIDGANSVKRIILRALDYLPPGEVSFADYGRAIIASDQAHFPNFEQNREWIREEFVRRKMVPSRKALEMETNFDHPAVKDLDLDDLVERDGVAYQFAEKNRQFLCIPAGIPFQVEPRLQVTKTYYYRGQEPKDITEFLFKVWWYTTEPNAQGAQFPSQRRLAVGTTLAIDWETRQVRALLTTNRSGQSDEEDEQRQDRDHFLGMLADDGILRPGQRSIGPDGKELRAVISAEDIKGVMRVRSMARMLHIVGRR